MKSVTTKGNERDVNDNNLNTQKTRFRVGQQVLTSLPFHLESMAETTVDGEAVVLATLVRIDNQHHGAIIFFDDPSEICDLNLLWLWPLDR